MEILDKYGYLESALGYVEKNIISGRNLKKLAQKAGVEESLLQKLSAGLKKFSEKQFFTNFKERIEEKHSSISGADVEISGVDISIESSKNKAFVSMEISCDIVVDDEIEEKIKIEMKIL